MPFPATERESGAATMVACPALHHRYQSRGRCPITGCTFSRQERISLSPRIIERCADEPPWHPFPVFDSVWNHLAQDLMRLRDVLA